MRIHEALNTIQIHACHISGNQPQLALLTLCPYWDHDGWVALASWTLLPAMPLLPHRPYVESSRGGGDVEVRQSLSFAMVARLISSSLVEKEML